jgi:hypothetical protein
MSTADAMEVIVQGDGVSWGESSVCAGERSSNSRPPRVARAACDKLLVQRHS